MRSLYTKGNEDKGIYRRDRVDGWGGEKRSRGRSLFERQGPLGSLPGVTGERLSIPSKGTRPLTESRRSDFGESAGSQPGNLLPDLVSQP